MRVLLLWDVDCVQNSMIVNLAGARGVREVVVVAVLSTRTARGRKWGELKSLGDTVAHALLLGGAVPHAGLPFRTLYEWALSLHSPEGSDALLERLLAASPVQSGAGDFDGVALATTDTGLDQAVANVLAHAGLVRVCTGTLSRPGSAFAGSWRRRHYSPSHAPASRTGAVDPHAQVLDAREAARRSAQPGQFPTVLPHPFGTKLGQGDLAAAACGLEMELPRLTQYAATLSSLGGIARLHPAASQPTGVENLGTRFLVEAGRGIEVIEPDVVARPGSTTLAASELGNGAVRLVDAGLTARCHLPVSVMPEVIEDYVSQGGLCRVVEDAVVRTSRMSTGAPVPVRLRHLLRHGAGAVQAEVQRAWQAQVSAWWFEGEVVRGQWSTEAATGDAKPWMPWPGGGFDVVVHAVAEVVAGVREWRLDLLAPLWPSGDVEVVVPTDAPSGAVFAADLADGSEFPVAVLAVDAAYPRNGVSYAAGSRLRCARLGEVDPGHPLVRLPLLVPVEVLHAAQMSDLGTPEVSSA